jgi:predicted dehydrogenase
MKKARTPSDDHRVRLAVIGVGLIGRQHTEIAARTKECRLVAISDVDARVKEKADELGTKYYGDYLEMINDNELDGVIVSVPNNQHATVGAHCAEKGLHILVEKPVATSVEEADRLVAAAKQNCVHLLVGHHRRFNPAIEEAHRIVQGGELGKLVGVTVMFALLKSEEYFQFPWRTKKGAGPILNNLTHEIDSLRYICGDIRRVYAEKSHEVRGYEVEDTANMTFRFASGAMGSVFMSDCVVSPWAYELTTGEVTKYFHSGENCYYFMGTKASLTFPHLKKVFYPDPARSGWFQPLVMEDLNVSYWNPYEKQIAHFCRVIRGEEMPRTSGEDGKKTMEVTMAIFKSCETGEPVDL